MIKDLKIEAPTNGKDDENSNAPSRNEARPGDKVYADKPPSFYDMDYEKYLKKFTPGITERSASKVQLRKLYKQEFLKQEDQYCLPTNGYKRRLG